MDHDDLHYERFKQEHTQRLDEKYAAWKKTRPQGATSPDMTSSETAPDQAPRYEGFLASFGRAIGEVTTVPSGPDSIDSTPTETRDTDRPGSKA